MIRRYLTIILLSVGILTVKAESHYVPHISVGMHGGVSGSRVSFSPAILQGWLIGPSGGLSVRYVEEKLVGIQAEVNYEQRGWSENFEESPLEYSRQLGYINVPILTHVNFGSPRARCFFNLGPQFAFLIRQETQSNFDINNPLADPDWPEDQRMTAQFTTEVKNKFDYGICAGVGFEYYMKPRHSVFIEARYYFGLGNIFPANKGSSFGASRNMSVAVTLGYNFRLY